jgi:3-oxoacyl-[acyl-carrier-protein] synthase II
VNPFSIPSIIPNMGAGWVSIELGTKGPLMSAVHGVRRVEHGDRRRAGRDPLGRADVMLAAAPRRRSPRSGSPASTRCARCRGGTTTRSARRGRSTGSRDGLVMGEAAAIVVLEELEHAKARGARIYAELMGYGVSSDASHMTEPDPTGENPARAMTMAIADAGVSPEDVGYINAHATSTPVGDASETRVIKRALGEEHAARTPVSSTKGATGHCFGAAGAVEAVFTVMAVHEQKLPPTINYEVEDPDCDLDYIPNESRDAPDLQVALSNSFGFGGHNASIVVRRWD